MGGIRQNIYPLQFNVVEKLHNCRLLKLQLAIYYIADSRGVIGKNVTTTTSHIGENFINKLLPFGRNGMLSLPSLCAKLAGRDGDRMVGWMEMDILWMLHSF